MPSPAANLRFGHAETVIPLAGLISLPGCAALPLDPDSIAASWHNYHVAPLAANIELVLAQAPSGEIYAAVAFNGRGVTLNGQKSQWLPWQTLRSYWLLAAASH